jgi:hypothetical protein
MRARTAVAGTTLALLALLWSAPTALAEEVGQGRAISTAAAPGDDQGNDDQGNDNAGRQATTPTTKPKPEPEPEPAPVTTKTPSPVPLPSPQPTKQQEIPVPQPKASLSLNPGKVKPGDSFSINAQCDVGQPSLSAQGAAVSGGTGQVAANTPDGTYTVTLTCTNGPNKGTATAKFTVAKDNPPPGFAPVKASLGVSPKTVAPGGEISANPHCEGGSVESIIGDEVRFNDNSGRVDEHAREGDHSVTLTCANGPNQKETARDTFRVDRKAGPGLGDPKAHLSVSPKVVRQGDNIYANGYCENSQQQALSGDDVRFKGDRGWVDDNAREGDHTVTRVCEIDGKRDVATDTFRVERGDGGGDGDGPRDFSLSDRSGYRGDEIDVSVRCREDRARLDSDVLDDITLHRDGRRLTGTTHVERNADYGWHRVTVNCDGHSKNVGFYVLRDRDHERYLDLDPGYGHRGDTIDVHAGCDWSVSELDGDGVLEDIDLDHNGRPWRYAGTTHVLADAKPGEHTIRIRCGDDWLEKDFFVKGDGDSDHDDGGSAGGGDTVSVYPKGAPETGGGPVRDSDPVGVTTLGLVGLAGAAGAGTYLVRRGVRR